MIWFDGGLVPTEANKTKQLNRLHGMGYTPGETEDTKKIDFTQ